MKIDYPLLLIILFLSFSSLYFFYGVSLPYSTKVMNDPLYYFKKFLIFNFLLPFLLFWLGYFLDWVIFKRIAKILFLINLIFLILPFLDFFKLPNQPTARWFYFQGFSFQPSEFMKISMLLFLASLLPLIKRKIEYFYISIGLVFLVSLIIYFQPALSNLLIFLAGIIGALMGSNINLRNIFILFFLVFLLIAFAFLWSYRSERILGIFKKDERGIGFQLNQSRLAIGSGGILGKGLGNSELKSIGLPLMLTDNIFAVYAEETGFIGSLVLIIIFNFLIFRILYLAQLVKDESKRFFAIGVACWLSAQVFVHLMSNLLISTGIPLPFFSYGPSSQIAIMISLGIISKFRN